MTPTGLLFAVGTEYSVIVPVLGLIEAIWLTPFSLNHMFPSGPSVIRAGTLAGVGVEYSVIVFGAAARILPTLAELFSVNQRYPFGPTSMLLGPALVVGTVKRVGAVVGDDGLR